MSTSAALRRSYAIGASEPSLRTMPSPPSGSGNRAPAAWRSFRDGVLGAEDDALQERPASVVVYRSRPAPTTHPRAETTSKQLTRQGRGSCPTGSAGRRGGEAPQVPVAAGVGGGGDAEHREYLHDHAADLVGTRTPGVGRRRNPYHRAPQWGRNPTRDPRRSCVGGPAVRSRSTREGSRRGGWQKTARRTLSPSMRRRYRNVDNRDFPPVLAPIGGGVDLARPTLRALANLRLDEAGRRA